MRSTATSARWNSSSGGAAALRRPTDNDMQQVLDHFGFDTPWILDDGHVWTSGLGEQRRYAIQHTLNYQIWDIETPHVPGGHGRSMTGHELDPAQAADFDQVWRTFALAARTEDH
ncbi:hypothetical protein [Krasilnikovia sp. MM14-A1004]|uniref:hypothetical protein n=1 Tax=Krasilnikovia sp. MM14-A1004 TaxID=3373541 RepID=UPI00399CB9F5